MRTLTHLTLELPRRSPNTTRLDQTCPMKISQEIYRSPRRWATALAVACAASSIAQAGVFYDESVSGDLSGSFAAPFQGGDISPGANTISGSSVSTDRDYITFTIPSGMEVTSMTLSSFVSTDDVIFVALTDGTLSINPATAGANLGSMLGYGLPGISQLGTDILDELAAGAGAAGFTTPLGPGDYTLWIQQTQAQNVAYSFDLTAVPEPADAAWAVAALLAGTAAYRHHQRRSANRQA